MEVADDVLEESLKSSVKKRLPQGIKRTAGGVDWQKGLWHSKETEDEKKTRCAIVQNDGIRARAIL